MCPDGVVQVLVVFSHGQLIALRDVVKAHGDFDQHSIQGEKNIELLPGAGSRERRVLQFTRSGFVVLCCRIHGSRIPWGRPNCSYRIENGEEREIETIDGVDHGRRMSANR